MKRFVVVPLVLFIVASFSAACKTETVNFDASDGDKSEIVSDGDITEDEASESPTVDGDSSTSDGDSSLTDGDGNPPDGDDDPPESDGDQESETEEIEGLCLSDADCKPDEFCDRLIPNIGEAGRCRTACFALDYECPEFSTCDEDPLSETYGHCVSDGYPDGDQDPDQDEDEKSCRICGINQDCPDGQYCTITGSPDFCNPIYGCCMDKCSSNDDCLNDLICLEDGRCGNEFTNCEGECPHGYVCDPVFNQCILNCPECGLNKCCDATSAPNCYQCNCQNPLVCGVLLPPCCFGYCCSAVVYGVLGYCI